MFTGRGKFSCMLSSRSTTSVKLLEGEDDGSRDAARTTNYIILSSNSRRVLKSVHIYHAAVTLIGRIMSRIRWLPCASYLAGPVQREAFVFVRGKLTLLLPFRYSLMK